MSYDIQVTIDSPDPHTLADWWAETLGWPVEPQDAEFIRSMIAQGHATEDQTKTHNGALVWTAGAAINSPAGLRVLFQHVEEPKAGKNRMHFDVRVGADQVEAEVEKLTARGAKFLWRASQGPLAWVTMADPEGNEFCIS